MRQIGGVSPTSLTHSDGPAWTGVVIGYSKTPSSGLLGARLERYIHDFEICSLRAWRMDAVMQRAPRDFFRELLAQGWIDAARSLYTDDAIHLLGT